jgi:diguanylate cyclase
VQAIVEFAIGYFQTRTLRRMWWRTAQLTVLITAAAVIISDVWFAFDKPEYHLALREWNVVSTIVIGIMLAGPLIFGFNLMAMHLTLANDSLQRLAKHDPLTGLLNRRAFQDVFETMARKSRRHGSAGCILVIDADNFKSINDRFGHDVGDRALVHLAGVISGASGGEAIIGRLGGEEFAVACFNAADPVEFAERIRKAVSGAPFWTGSQRLPLSISIGVTEIDETRSLREALSDADQGLYRAKGAGRNRVMMAGRAPSLAPRADDMDALGGFSAPKVLQ